MLRHTAWQMFTDISESFRVTHSKKCTSSTARNRTALRTFEISVTIYQSIRSNISQDFWILKSITNFLPANSYSILPCLALENESLYYREAIPVAVRSKAYVWGGSITGVAGSNPAAGRHVCLLRLLWVVYVAASATSWPRIQKSYQACVRQLWGGLGPRWAAAEKKK